MGTQKRLEIFPFCLFLHTPKLSSPYAPETGATAYFFYMYCIFKWVTRVYFEGDPQKADALLDSRVATPMSEV